MVRSLFVHLGRCIGCRACEVACEREHEGQPRVFVTSARPAVPRACRQCTGSPCAAVCPTGALTPDGRFDRTRCTGCTLCVFACPFGVLGVSGRVVSRCDLCRDRPDGTPACALTCPTGAIVYESYGAYSQHSRRKAAQHLLDASRKAGS